MIEQMHLTMLVVTLILWGACRGHIDKGAKFNDLKDWKKALVAALVVMAISSVILTFVVIWS